MFLSGIISSLIGASIGISIFAKYNNWQLSSYFISILALFQLLSFIILIRIMLSKYGIEIFEDGKIRSAANKSGSLQIKDSIQEEIKNIVDVTLEEMISEQYDESGKLIQSSFYTKIEEGHWVNIKFNNSDSSMLSEHIRTKTNWEAIQKIHQDRQILNVEYDKEYLFKTLDHRFSKDITEKTAGGILVARK